MRVVVAVLLFVGCEKATGVETSSGSGSSTTTATTPVIVQPDASLGTTPNDAAVVAKAPADAAAVVDAARREPRTRDSVSMSEADAARIADMLTAMSPADWTEGDMSKRRPNADLGRQFDDGGRTVEIVGGRGARGDGSPRVGTGAGTKIDGGVKAVDPRPPGRVSVSNKQAFDESTLTPDAVLSKIQSAYMAGIKRCYKSYLTKDASARGKVRLTITVNESGRSISSKATGFASEIDDCVTGLMASWTFPPPKDRDGDATDASFSIDLTLVPD